MEFYPDLFAVSGYFTAKLYEKEGRIIEAEELRVEIDARLTAYEEASCSLARMIEGKASDNDIEIAVALFSIVCEPYWKDPNYYPELQPEAKRACDELIK